MKYLMMALMLLTISCNTAKQGARQIEKGAKKNKRHLALVCSREFPNTETVIDTVTTTEYDFVEIACPGYDTITKKDTIFKYKTNVKRVVIDRPVYVQQEAKREVIRIKVKDSATGYLLNMCNQDNAKLDYHNGRLNRWLFWLIVALVGSLALNVINLVKK